MRGRDEDEAPGAVKKSQSMETLAPARERERAGPYMKPNRDSAFS